MKLKCSQSIMNIFISPDLANTEDKTMQTVWCIYHFTKTKTMLNICSQILIFNLVQWGFLVQGTKYNNTCLFYNSFLVQGDKIHVSFIIGTQTLHYEQLQCLSGIYFYNNQKLKSNEENSGHRPIHSITS